VKILFVIGSLERAGAERQLILTARGMQQLGHSVQILCWDDYGDLAEEARAQGVVVLKLSNEALFSTPKIFHYIRIVRSFGPDVIYPFLPRQHLRVTLLKWLTAPAKIVWGICASEVNWKLFKLRARIFFPLTSTVSHLADLYISNSEKGAGYHISIGYDPKKMHVIPNGIDREVFRKNLSARQEQRNLWRVDEGKLVIGMLARFDPLKGQDLFLQVASILQNELSNPLFVVTGKHTSEEGERYLQTALRLGLVGNFIIEPATKHPENFLNGVDVLVVPSLSEGLPNLVLEGLACGTRMVCTDVGDIGLALNGAEVLVPPNDPRALADGVVTQTERTTSNTQQELIDNGIQDLAKAVEKVFKSIATGRFN
jgi:glycosyltransferase involved in cell wall biosynthesis